MASMRINLGSVEHIALGQGRCFMVGVHEVAMFRTRAGRLFAVENSCPHRGGPLADGIIGEGKVVCPLHGHKFDLSTGQGSEAHECVKTFKVWEERGQIVMLFDFSAEIATDNHCVTQEAI